MVSEGKWNSVENVSHRSFNVTQFCVLNRTSCLRAQSGLAEFHALLVCQNSCWWCYISENIMNMLQRNVSINRGILCTNHTSHSTVLIANAASCLSNPVLNAWNSLSSPKYVHCLALDKLKLRWRRMIWLVCIVFNKLLFFIFLIFYNEDILLLLLLLLLLLSNFRHCHFALAHLEWHLKCSLVLCMFVEIEI